MRRFGCSSLKSTVVVEIAPRANDSLTAFSKDKSREKYNLVPGMDFFFLTSVLNECYGFVF